MVSVYLYLARAAIAPGHLFGFPTPKQQAVESISLPYPTQPPALTGTGEKGRGPLRVWLTKIWSIFI